MHIPKKTISIPLDMERQDAAFRSNAPSAPPLKIRGGRGSYDLPKSISHPLNWSEIFFIHNPSTGFSQEIYFKINRL